MEFAEFNLTGVMTCPACSGAGLQGTQRCAWCAGLGTVDREELVKNIEMSETWSDKRWDGPFVPEV